MNIIFDIGMVLADFRWREYSRERGIPESSIDLLEERMILDPIWDEFDRNVIPPHELIEKISERFTDIPDDYRKYWEDVRGMVLPFDYSENWLKGLKEQGHNIYILSNYSEFLFRVHSQDFTFLKYTDGRVVSYEYKVLKPDPKIYNILLEKFGIDPADSVFIDDRPVNIEGAERCGIRGIIFTDFPKAGKKLDEVIRERSEIK